MKKITTALLSLGVIFCIISCDNSTGQNQNGEIIERNNEKVRFPDFGYMLPADKYKGKVFELSADYPKTLPEKDEALKSILSIDFKGDWERYMYAVRNYIFQGNAKDDYENSFFLLDNKVRKWYHVPWQHWGEAGREGFHGLTQEGPIGGQTLGPTQHSKSHAYAVGFYNDMGGYNIGKVWNSVNPDVSYLKTNAFPEGTVVGKLLFVPLSEEEVPYLKNPLGWNAYIYESDIPNNAINSSNKGRTQYKVNLIQMDIMVKDSSAISTGGWVFGTFVYQGNLNKKNKWENLIPVGIQWGNDPDNKDSDYNPKPTKTIINLGLKETIINPSKDLPIMHLGFNFRLSGPVDNSYSSCMSCHSTAQYPVISNILPQFNAPAIPIPSKSTEASEKWMKWFRNIPCGEPFDKEAISFDNSLQLVKSIQNYIEYSSIAKKGIYHEDYWSNGYKVTRNVLEEK